MASTGYEKKIRLLDYIKRLQGPGEDIWANNETSENTIESDFKDLVQGFEFLGWQIRLPRFTRGKKKYGDSKADLNDSTFHPLFMCLNLSELFVLVKSLKDSDKEVSKDLLKMILKQSSPYAKSKLISIYPDLRTLDDPNWELRNRQENEILSSENIISYFVKPGRKVEVILKTLERHKGYIHDFQENNWICLESEGKKIKFPIAEVIRIIGTN